MSDGEIAAPSAGMLYLPQKWCADSERLRKVGVPEGVVFKTKPQIAIDLLELMVYGVALFTGLSSREFFAM